MKKTLGALLLTIGLIAGPLTAVSAAPDPGDEVKGPTCGDITASANYQDRFPANDPAREFVATVFGAVDTAKPSCSSATYTLSVYAVASAPGAAPLAEASARGDGTTHIELQATVTSEPSAVCVVLSSSVGGHLIDQAPNEPDGPCTIGTHLLLNGGVGASGMR